MAYRQVEQLPRFQKSSAAFQSRHDYRSGAQSWRSRRQLVEGWRDDRETEEFESRPTQGSALESGSHREVMSSASSGGEDAHDDEFVLRSARRYSTTAPNTPNVYGSTESTRNVSPPLQDVRIHTRERNLCRARSTCQSSRSRKIRNSSEDSCDDLADGTGNTQDSDAREFLAESALDLRPSLQNATASFQESSFSSAKLNFTNPRPAALDSSVISTESSECDSFHTAENGSASESERLSLAEGRSPTYNWRDRSTNQKSDARRGAYTPAVPLCSAMASSRADHDCDHDGCGVGESDEGRGKLSAGGGTRVDAVRIRPGGFAGACDDEDDDENNEDSADDAYYYNDDCYDNSEPEEDLPDSEEDSFDEDRQEYVGHLRHEKDGSERREELQAVLDACAQGEYSPTPRHLLTVNSGEDPPCPYHSPEDMGYSKRYLPAKRKIFPQGDELSDEVRVRWSQPFSMCMHHFKRFTWRNQRRRFGQTGQGWLAGRGRERTAHARDGDENDNLHIFSIFYRGPPLGNGDSTTLETFVGADNSTRDYIQTLAQAHDIEMVECVLEERPLQSDEEDDEFHHDGDDSEGSQSEGHGQGPFQTEVQVVFATHKRGAAYKTFRVLVNLARGDYLRNEARRLDLLREIWKEEAQEAYNRKDFKQASESSKKKKRYARSMEQAHEEAAENLFEFFNASRSWDQIDLHHLRVADCEAKDRLEERMEEVMHKRVDTKCRAKWLEVISGAGIHSRDGSGKLYNHVKLLLQQWQTSHCYGHFEINSVNRGAFVLTYEQYTGDSPCFGYFYCTHVKCGPRAHNIPLGRSWGSKEVWIQYNGPNRKNPAKLYNQACFECKKHRRWHEGDPFPCQPFKIMSLNEPRPKFLRSYTRGVAINPESSRRECHKPELCEMCTRLGHPCV